MQMELNLMRDVKNTKRFCRYFGQKRKAKESCPLKIEKGELATIGIDKTEAFNMLFVYICRYVICLTGS